MRGRRIMTAVRGWKKKDEDDERGVKIAKKLDWNAQQGERKWGNLAKRRKGKMAARVWKAMNETRTNPIPEEPCTFGF